MEFGKKIVYLIFSFLFTFTFDINDGIQWFKDIDFNRIDNFVLNIKDDYNSVLLAREKYSNEEIVGKLNISSVDIFLPIVQHSDNEFYLSRDEYKNKNNVGSIFLDYRNNIDIDRKLLIFGHNSKTIDTEFNKLENFLNDSFFSNVDNRKIILETKNKIVEYEISSVVITVDDFQHMKLAFTEDEWKKHIVWINSSSLYDDNFLDISDDILIMQTCYYDPENSYLLVVAKKIKEAFY